MRTRQHPAAASSVPVSLAVYRQLLNATGNSGYQREDWEIAAEAIDEWMRRHYPEGLAAQPAAGYQWKHLFLPSGTLLRTVFAGKNHHAIVEGDQILYQGATVSPSRFVNAVGGIRRNAWRAVWIRFPESNEWKLADTLRNRHRPRPARKAASSASQPAPPQPVAAIHSPCERACVAATATATATAGSTSVPPPARIDKVKPVAMVEAIETIEAIDTVESIETTARTEAIESDTPDTLAPPALQPAVDTRAQAALTGSAQTAPDDAQTRSGAPSAPRHPAGAGNSSSADARMAALLQQELLPLLYRICALDRLASTAHDAPDAPGH